MIQQIDNSQTCFLNKFTILYGPCATGKTSTIRYIMSHLLNVVPNVIVCRPSEKYHDDYDHIPTACVYNDLSEELVQNITANLDVNPNLLLIVDAPSSYIEKWHKMIEAVQLFCADKRVTMLLTAQSVHSIPARIRKRSDVNIFTTERITKIFHDTAASETLPELRAQIADAASTVFIDPRGKLVVDRAGDIRHISGDSLTHS